MIYALFVFHWRASRIRTRGKSDSAGGFGGFDDRWGPTVLTGALIAAVVVNFILRVGIGKLEKSGKQHEGLKMVVGEGQTVM